MQRDNLPGEIRQLFTRIISKDILEIRRGVDACYDEECVLQNPYMLLNGREEILRSYIALANSNVELRCDVDTITYDPTSQTLMVDMTQYSSPKALGGLIPIKIHQILTLQLESSPINPDLLLIARHNELHITQDYITQLPIVGGLYETGFRSALGQITLASSAVLEYTGILDSIPAGVKMVKGVASSARATVGEIVGKALSVGSTLTHASGVDRVISASMNVGGKWAGEIRDVVGWATEGAKSQAAAFMEEGKGVVVDCYSYSCRPGQFFSESKKKNYMVRSNPLSLRLRGLINWPSNVRHPVLSQYIKHIFQDFIVAEPGIRSSTTGLWVNVTLFGPRDLLDKHPKLKNPVLDFSKSKLDKALGRAELRIANISASDKNVFLNSLFKDVPKTKLTRFKGTEAEEFEGISPTVLRAQREGVLNALRIYRDTPIHMQINVINNPILNADVMAQYIAKQLALNRTLPRIYKTILKRLN
ncbi:hypothetical protein HDU97_002762 [Phlyctochytrium planicorne]|nr:hypothetical protein HDU97_002762 [Phlyctochytrium planicorne]